MPTLAQVAVTATVPGIGIFRQNVFHLVVYARNNVRCYQPVTDALTRIRTGTHSRVHRTSFATHQHRNVTAADKLATNQAHFRRFGHRVRRFNRRH